MKTLLSFKLEMSYSNIASLTCSACTTYVVQIKSEKYNEFWGKKNHKKFLYGFVVVVVLDEFFFFFCWVLFSLIWWQEYILFACEREISKCIKRGISQIQMEIIRQGTCFSLILTFINCFVHSISSFKYKLIQN